MQKITVREFLPEDNAAENSALLPALLRIWNAPENLKYLSKTLIPFAPELVQAWLDNHKQQGGRYFCALDEKDSILGVMVVKEDLVEGFEIYGLGVLPERKRSGVGRVLVEHATIAAEDRGFNDVKALVFVDNTAMLCLLLTSGYQPVSMEHHKRSDGVDAVWLKRRVGKLSI